jgi:hypothetical protein
MAIQMEGRFCSYSCALAYGNAHPDECVRRSMRTNMTALLVSLRGPGFDTVEERRGALTGERPFPFKEAPSRVVLRRFGGPKTVEEFRAFADDPSKFVSVESSARAMVVPVQFGVFIEDLSKPLFKPRCVTADYSDKREILDAEERTGRMTGTGHSTRPVTKREKPDADPTAHLRQRPSSKRARAVPLFRGMEAPPASNSVDFLEMMKTLDSMREPAKPEEVYKPLSTTRRERSAGPSSRDRLTKVGGASTHSGRGGGNGWARSRGRGRGRRPRAPTTARRAFGQTL